MLTGCAASLLEETASLLVPSVDLQQYAAGQILRCIPGQLPDYRAG